MIELTDDFLKLKPGTICYWPATLDHPVAGTWHITIPLEPFSADDEYEPATFRPGDGGPELVKTEISLDHIHLSATELTGLSQRTFTFPVNPEDGYIDGSIYLVASHCPVDVTASSSAKPPRTTSPPPSTPTSTSTPQAPSTSRTAQPT
ncbi:hypothetical protein [Actinomadura livida]|uniref:Uncharacterized protein n=1 Tax=Actinomadura livida TaxID=79909 RepID=A0A7W7MVQ2_9ACTN|nr:MULTISPECIES: hypothetical protein [Actinomadura]MBB4772100.1 hypothetical protein [Actinomadura catellatispora]GGU37341.1 hypothetical protein GCM10010208_72180 [Actinomadura livida]